MNRFFEMIQEMDDYIALGGVTKECIDDAENLLNVKFAKEYGDYLLKCGTATAGGHEFTGLDKSERLNVIKVTEENRRRNRRICDNLYVVEQLGIDKIVIWQSESGEIYQTVADSEPWKIADSMVEYLNL